MKAHLLVIHVPMYELRNRGGLRLKRKVTIGGIAKVGDANMVMEAVLVEPPVT